MNSARRVIFSLLLAGSPIVSAHANPAPLDEARQIQCMLEHTISNDEVVFKDMMGMNLALTKRDVGMSALATPPSGAAGKLLRTTDRRKLMKRPLIN